MLNTYFMPINAYSIFLAGNCWCKKTVIGIGLALPQSLSLCDILISKHINQIRKNFFSSL